MTFRNEWQRDEFVALVREQQLDLLVAGPVARLGMKGGGTLEEAASSPR